MQLKHFLLINIGDKMYHASMLWPHWYGQRSAGMQNYWGFNTLQTLTTDLLMVQTPGPVTVPELLMNFKCVPDIFLNSCN
jgi:hypothetical protein